MLDLNWIESWRVFYIYLNQTTKNYYTMLERNLLIKLFSEFSLQVQCNCSHFSINVDKKVRHSFHFWNQNEWQVKPMSISSLNIFWRKKDYLESFTINDGSIDCVKEKQASFGWMLKKSFLEIDNTTHWRLKMLFDKIVSKVRFELSFTSNLNQLVACFDVKNIQLTSFIAHNSTLKNINLTIS